jgi:peptidylprolyl isomerase
MITLDTIVGALGEQRLTVGGLLEWLRASGRLGPLVREALAAQLVKEEARRAGLSVPVEEVQAAADAFRRRQGLDTVADTQAWLAAQGLSLDDFEAHLEGGLLAARLKQHLTGPQVEEHFSAHRAGLEQLRLSVVFAGRDDLARELASQVRDEGRDLGEVARAHGLSVVQQRLLLEDLGAPLASALTGASASELVGPVETPQGLALVVVEERRAAELDAATRQRIQDMLFARWMSARLGEATLAP